MSTDDPFVAEIFPERYPVDIGQEYMMEYIQKHNAGALWDQLSVNFTPEGG